MAYGLKSETYAYETLLNILKDNPKGLTVSEMKRDHGVNKHFDIKGLMRWKGVVKQEREGIETHYESIAINKTKSVIKLTEAGLKHLKENEHLIQRDILNVKLIWKNGHGPDDRVSTTKPKRNERQEVLALEEPIILSSTAQRAAELLNTAIASNHSAKTAIEEIHVLIARYFESYVLDEKLKQETGIIGEVVAEAVSFREVLESITELTTESLTEDLIEN